MACVYCIKNDINNKVYIGKTIHNVEKRFKEHIRDARSHRRTSKFHNAIKKYGEEHFYPIVLEECEEDIVGIREQYYIQLYDSVNNGYNLSYGGEGESTVDLSELISLYNQGYNYTEISMITGHARITVSNKLNNAGYTAKVGVPGKPNGYKGKSIEFQGQQFESLTSLAEYLKTNVDEFKNIKIKTIVNKISSHSKNGTKYHGYNFNRL